MIRLHCCCFLSKKWRKNNNDGDELTSLLRSTLARSPAIPNHLACFALKQNERINSNRCWINQQIMELQTEHSRNDTHRLLDEYWRWHIELFLLGFCAPCPSKTYWMNLHLCAQPNTKEEGKQAQSSVRQWGVKCFVVIHVKLLYYSRYIHRFSECTYINNLNWKNSKTEWTNRT